jgi:hypothetical protein
MSRIAMLTALLAGVGLVACTHVPEPSPPKPGLAAATCDTGSGSGRCDVTIRPGSMYSCEIGRFDINPEYLQLRGGRPVNLFWRIDPPFAFCGTDSVFLKPNLAQDYLQPFESFGADTDDGSRGPNAAMLGKCKQRWHWNWRNSGSALYQYNIEITDTRTGRKCTIDPWVRNG